MHYEVGCLLVSDMINSYRRFSSEHFNISEYYTILADADLIQNESNALPWMNDHRRGGQVKIPHCQVIWQVRRCR